MVQNGQITFYTHPTSPFCQRVHIALEEAKADYTSFLVNTRAKPEWYSSKVNPVTGKIPALSYGGPKHPPEEPSSDATVLVESNVIVEFIAETFPSTNLLPRDPILRANARIFMSIIDGKVIDGVRTSIFAGGPASGLLAGFEALQARLPSAGFAVGEWSIADIAAAPILAWILLLLENEYGRYPVGEGKKMLEALREPKFARIVQYVQDVKARASFRAIWDEAGTLAQLKANPALRRD